MRAIAAVKRVVSMCALLCALVMPVNAEEAGRRNPYLDLSLEELLQHTATVSKRDEAVSDTFGLAFVTSDDRIRQIGARNAWDVLAWYPMFYVRHSLASDLWRTVYTRGQKWSSQFLLDDQPVVSNEWMRALNVDLIKQVDVVVSPGSTLWGQNSSLGVVNFLTKQGRDVNGTEVSIDAGTFNTLGASLLYGDVTSNGVDFILSLDVNQTEEPELEFPRHVQASTPTLTPQYVDRAVETKTSTDRMLHLYSKVSHAGFTGSVMAYENRDFWPLSARGDVISTTDDTTFQGRIRQRGFDVSPRYDYRLTDEITLTGKYHFSTMKEENFNLYHFKGNRVIPAGQRVKIDVPETRRQTIDVQAAGAFRWASLLVGYNRWDDDVEGSTLHLYDRVTGIENATIPSADTGQVIDSIYAQAEIPLVDRIVGQIAARYAEPDRYDSVVSPKAGLLFRANEHLSAKLLYQRGWKAPEVGWWTSPQDRIDPEETEAYEAELSYVWSKTALAKFSLSYVDTNGATLTKLENSGSFTTTKENERSLWTGILHAEKRFPRYGDLFFIYSYNGVDERSATPVPSDVLDVFERFTPEHAASLGWSYPVSRRLELTTTARYVGETQAFNSYEPGGLGTFGGFRSVTFDPYLLVNFNVTVKGDFAGMEWAWENKVFNVFDKDYENPNDRFSTVPIPGSPLTYLSTLRVYF